MSATLHVLFEAEPCLEGEADLPACHQLGQISVLQYVRGTAGSMDHQQVFRHTGLFLQVLATEVALDRQAGQGGKWQVVWCLGTLSPLLKAFPQVLQVYDDRKCTKLYCVFVHLYNVVV